MKDEEIKVELIDSEIVKDYLYSLILGVVLLYIFWKCVILLASDISQIYRYGIGFAALIALIIARRYRRE